MSQQRRDGGGGGKNSHRHNESGSRRGFHSSNATPWPSAPLPPPGYDYSVAEGRDGGSNRRGGARPGTSCPPYPANSSALAGSPSASTAAATPGGAPGGAGPFPSATPSPSGGAGGFTAPSSSSAAAANALLEKLVTTSPDGEYVMVRPEVLQLLMQQTQLAAAVPALPAAAPAAAVDTQSSPPPPPPPSRASAGAGSALPPFAASPTPSASGLAMPPRSQSGSYQQQPSATSAAALAASLPTPPWFTGANLPPPPLPASSSSATPSGSPPAQSAGTGRKGRKGSGGAGPQGRPVGGAGPAPTGPVPPYSAMVDGAAAAGGLPHPYATPASLAAFLSQQQQQQAQRGGAWHSLPPPPPAPPYLQSDPPYYERLGLPPPPPLPATAGAGAGAHPPAPLGPFSTGPFPPHPLAMLSGAASASSGPAPHGKRGGGHGGNAAPGGGGGRGSRPAPPGAASSSATEDRHDTTSVNGQEAGNGSRFKVGGWYEGVVKRYNPLRGYGFLTGQFVLAFDPADCENVCCSDVDEVLKNAHTAAPTPVVTGGKAENPPHHDASMATEGNVSFTHPASTATAPFTDEEGGDDASKGGHRGSVVPSTMQWYLYHLEEQGKLDHQAAPLGDIFVHHSCISMDGFRVLPIGAPVRFSVAVLMNTVQAVDVIPLGEEWMKRPSLTCELVFTQPTPPPFTISPTAATVLRYHILSKQEQEKRKHKAAASAASSGGGGDGAGENDDTASDGEGSASSSAVGDAVAYLSVTWNDMVVVPSPAIPNSLESRSELQAVPVHSLPKPTPPSVKTAVPSSASSTATGKRPRTSESVAPHRTLTEPPPSYKDLPPLPVDTTAPAGSVHSSMRGGAQNSSESNSTTAAGKPHTGSSAEGTTSSQQVGDGSSASPLFQMMMSGGKGSNSQPATGDEFSGGGLTNSANVNGSGGERGTTQTHITNSQNSPQGNSQGPNSQEMTATESSNKDREQQTVSSQETSGRGEVQGAGNAHVHKHTDANAENAATGGGAVEHKSHHHHRTNTGGGGGKGEAAAAAAAAAGEGRGEEHILTPASSNRRQHVSSDSSNQLGAGSDDEKDTTTTGSGTANSGSTLPETKFVNDDPSANWDDVFDRKIANERVKDVLLRKTDLRFFPYKAASGAAAAAAAAAAAIAAAGKEAASAVAVPEVVPLSAVGELDSSSSRGVENDGGSTDPTDTDHQPQTNSSGEGPTQISDEPRYEEQQRHKLEEVERKRAARRRSRSKERRDVAHATAHAAGENKTEEGTTASPPLVVVPVKDLPPAVASQVPPGVFFIALPQSVVSQLGIHVHPNGTPHTTPAADGAGAGSQRKLRSHRSSTEESRHGSAHSSPSQVQMNAMLAGYQSSASSASPSRRLPPGSQVSFPQLVPRSTVSSTSSHMPAIFPTLPRKPMNSVQLPIPPWLDPKPAGESEVTSLPMDTFDTDSSCTPTHTANSAGAFVFYPHRAASTSAHRRHHRRNDSTKGAGCHHNPIPLGTRGPLGEDWQASDSARGDSYHSAAEGFDRAPGGSGDGTTSSRSWQSPQSFMAPGGVFTDEVASSPERQSQSVQSPSSPSRHEGQPGGPGKAPGPSSPGATGGLMTSGYNMWQS